MSPMNKFGALAFASAALAVPHVNHQRFHARDAPPAYGTSSAPVDPASSAPPYPYPSSSSAAPYGTGFYGTGTGYANPTGYSASSYAAPSYPASYSSGDPTWPASYSIAPTCTAYTSTCIWRSTTSVTTIYLSPTPAPSYSADPGYSAGAGSYSADPGYTGGAGTCAADTTVTTTQTWTITVTAGEYDPTTAPAYSAPVSSAPVYSAPAYSAPASSDPVSAPAYSAPAAYADPSASVAPASASYAPSSAAPEPATYSSQPTGRGAGFKGKRGLAYNTASLTEPFLSAPSVGWGYNWGSESNGLSSAISYIPELHTLEFASSWAANAAAAISSGSQYLFSLNEPDMTSQANMTPQQAVAAWNQYMEPFHNQATLVAPSVTNSGSPNEGIDWLRQFIAACEGCHIGAVNQHWYDSTSNDLTLFQSQIDAVASEFGLPVFVGEFGFIGSDSDISSSLEQALTYLDGKSEVVGYAYYFVSDGLLVDGESPSSYGATYVS